MNRKNPSMLSLTTILSIISKKKRNPLENHLESRDSNLSRRRVRWIAEGINMKRIMNRNRKKDIRK